MAGRTPAPAAAATLAKRTGCRFPAFSGEAAATDQKRCDESRAEQTERVRGRADRIGQGLFVNTYTLVSRRLPVITSPFGAGM
jgi:hypothetical protein